MQKLDPFVYTPLDLTKPSLRLIKLTGLDKAGRITCQLRETQLSESKYLALSYAWGSTRRTSTIVVNGKALQIGSNLHGFLQQIARVAYEKNLPGEGHRRRYGVKGTRCEGFLDKLVELHSQHLSGQSCSDVHELWIDAICLDQSNSQERNHQVEQMYNIYCSAQCVLVWLGGFDGSYSTVQKWLLDVMTWSDKAKDPENDSRILHYLSKDWFEFKRLWDCEALTTFLNLRYWTRLWIVQELAAARDKILLFGPYALDWNAFWHTVRCLTPVPKRFRHQYEYSRAYKHYKLSNQIQSNEPFNFWDLLLEFNQLASSDQRDQIYALTSMFRDQQIFHINYQESKVQLAMRASCFLDGTHNLQRFDILINVLEISAVEIEPYKQQASVDPDASAARCKICGYRFPYIYKRLPIITPLLCLKSQGGVGHAFNTRSSILFSQDQPTLGALLPVAFRASMWRSAWIGPCITASDYHETWLRLETISVHQLKPIIKTVDFNVIRDVSLEQPSDRKR